MSGIIVIGGGIAGQALCEALRDRDPEVPITLVCGERHLPYDRVQLSEMLVSGRAVEELQLRPDAWYADRGVTVRTGARVLSADLESGVAELDDGTQLSFDRLALATGSNALVPPIPGLDRDGVHVFRGPEDCDAIRAAAAGGARHAAVIGGGLLGLEAARGIAAQGCPVTVVHLVDRLMERQLDAGSAAMLLPRLADLGVDVQLQRATQEAYGNGRVEGLCFAGGDVLEADLLVVSVGISPETTLARDLGLSVERGIVVDDQMRSSDARVIALGECAQHRGMVYGLVAPIHDQAQVAADTLLGRDAAYEGTLLSTKLKVAGIDLVSIGDATGNGEAVVADAQAGVYRKIVTREGRAAGAILLGDIRGSEALLDAVRRATEVEDPLAALADAAQTSAADLPDDAQVCNCNGVCKGAIAAAVIEGGCTSSREVMSVTRAGTGCGSCKPAVLEIVRAATGGAAEEPHFLCPCKRQTREHLAAQVREHGWTAVSEVSAACGTGNDCGACKPGLAYLVDEVNAGRHREERSARYINDRVHANIQKDGTFSVVPRMRGGVVSPDELRRIADAADKYDVPLVKVTGGQRIDLLGVKKEDLPGIWADLDMPSGHAYAKAVRTVKTCVGEQFCRFGLGDSMGLGVEIEEAWEGLYTPAKVKAGVSGCPRNCAEATIKDIGIVGVEGGWQVRVGGAAGASVREADVLTTVETRAMALRISTAFLQYYREHAEYKERSYDFVPRIGLEELRAIVLDEERCAELVERLKISQAATTDPWLERDAPYHPKQFHDLDSDAATPALVGPPSGGAR